MVLHNHSGGTHDITSWMHFFAALLSLLCDRSIATAAGGQVRGRGCGCKGVAGARGGSDLDFGGGDLDFDGEGEGGAFLAAEARATGTGLGSGEDFGLALDAFDGGGD